jgi:hypothetical protein
MMHAALHALPLPEPPQETIRAARNSDLATMLGKKHALSPFAVAITVIARGVAVMVKDLNQWAELEHPRVDQRNHLALGLAVEREVARRCDQEHLSHPDEGILRGVRERRQSLDLNIAT